MKETCVIEANAKLNLLLYVTARRDDGYHNLHSVMQSVDLCDRLRLTRSQTPGVRLTCSDAAMPVGAENLAVRAADAFFGALNLSDAGLEIDLDKRIPPAAGLAGGSADAAAVLTGLNALYDRPLDTAALLRLGATIGADLPFCLVGGTQSAEGIGEKLTPLAPLPDCHIVICKPSDETSTAQAYAALDKRGLRSVCPPLPDTGDLIAVCRSLHNDFEAVADPEVLQQIKTTLRNFETAGCLMTGSGPAVFGLFTDPVLAESCAAQLRRRYSAVFVCRPAPSGCRIRA